MVCVCVSVCVGLASHCSCCGSCPTPADLRFPQRRITSSWFKQQRSSLDELLVVPLWPLRFRPRQHFSTNHTQPPAILESALIIEGLGRSAASSRSCSCSQDAANKRRDVVCDGGKTSVG